MDKIVGPPDGPIQYMSANKFAGHRISTVFRSNSNEQGRSGLPAHLAVKLTQL